MLHGGSVGILRVCRRNGSPNSFNGFWRIRLLTSWFLDHMEEAIWILPFSFWSFGKEWGCSSECTHMPWVTHSRDFPQLWFVRKRHQEVWPNLQTLSGAVYQTPQPDLWISKIQQAVTRTGWQYWCLCQITSFPHEALRIWPFMGTNDLRQACSGTSQFQLLGEPAVRIQCQTGAPEPVWQAWQPPDQYSGEKIAKILL